VLAKSSPIIARRRFLASTGRGAKLRSTSIGKVTNPMNCGSCENLLSGKDFREENRRIQAKGRGPEGHSLLTNPMKRG
jgi:hypothetical protein